MTCNFLKRFRAYVRGQCVNGQISAARGHCSVAEWESQIGNLERNKNITLLQRCGSLPLSDVSATNNAPAGAKGFLSVTNIQHTAVIMFHSTELG